MTGSGKELVPVKRGRGRPIGSGLMLTEEMADEICDRLTHGETLISICRQDRDGNLRFKGEFPNHATVYDWADPSHIGYRGADFSQRFARAKLEQQKYWLEEAVDIANNPEMGVEETVEYGGKDGTKIKRVKKDMTAHRMLKIKTRLDVIARMNPLLWSERLVLAQAAQAAGAGSEDGTKIVIEGGLPDAPPAPAGLAPPSEPSGSQDEG